MIEHLLDVTVVIMLNGLYLITGVLDCLDGSFIIENSPIIFTEDAVLKVDELNREIFVNKVYGI